MKPSIFHLGLIEHLLTLIVAASQARTSFTPDRIQFINEENAGRGFLGACEEITDPAGPNAHQHLDKFRAGQAEKGHIGFSGNRSGKQGFAGSGWPNEQDASGNLADQALKAPGCFQKLDDLDQLIFGFVHASYIRKGCLRFPAGVGPRVTSPAREEATLGGADTPAELPEEPAEQEQWAEEEQCIQSEGRVAVARWLHLDCDVGLHQERNQVGIAKLGDSGREMRGRCSAILRGHRGCEDACDGILADVHRAHVIGLNLCHKGQVTYQFIARRFVQI